MLKVKEEITIVDFTVGREQNQVILANGGTEKAFDRYQALTALKNMVREGKIEGNDLHRVMDQTGIETVSFTNLNRDKRETFNMRYLHDDVALQNGVNQMEAILARKRKLRVGKIAFPNGLKKAVATVTLGAALVGGFTGLVWAVDHGLDHNDELLENQAMEQVYVPTAEEIEQANLEYQQEQMVEMQGRQR